MSTNIYGIKIWCHHWRQLFFEKCIFGIVVGLLKNNFQNILFQLFRHSIYLFKYFWSVKQSILALMEHSSKYADADFGNMHVQAGYNLHFTLIVG